MDQPLSKHDWASAVVARLTADQQDAGALYWALQTSADDAEVGSDKIPDPLVDPWKALEFTRGDEVEEAYSGDILDVSSPSDYAELMLDEWNGPE